MLWVRWFHTFLKTGTTEEAVKQAGNRKGRVAFLVKFTENKGQLGSTFL